MKSAVPIIAFVVAALLVLSQSIYTVDQRQYAIKFQLGEFIDAKTEAGLYFKVPLVQNIKFYDRRILLLDAPRPDRITTSEKKPLNVDFIAYWRIADVRQYYQSVTGDEELAKHAGARIRAILGRRSTSARSTKRSTERDNHEHHAAAADADAKQIGVEIVDVRLRRVELPGAGAGLSAHGIERKRVANELRSQGATGPRRSRRRRPAAQK
jgi:membrane protease subunit HflC